MSFAILRTAKLKTFGNIAGSLHHTFRSIDTPNANPELTHLNVNTFQNTEIALEKIRERIPEKRRKDAVLCVEYLITGSPEWEGWTNNKKDEYFNNAKQWLEDKHGKENVVMTSIQLDESTPHMVAYVVPIDEKGKLNAKKFLGGREKLREMQTEFAQNVGEKLGLKRGIEGSKADHQTIKNYYAKVNNTETLPSVNIEIPEKGIFEKHESYENRIFQMLEKEVSPILQNTYALQNELSITRKKLENAQNELQNMQEKIIRLNVDTVVYNNAIRQLPPDPEYISRLNAHIEQDVKNIIAQYKAEKGIFEKPRPSPNAPAPQAAAPKNTSTPIGMDLAAVLRDEAAKKKAAELKKMMDFELVMDDEMVEVVLPPITTPPIPERKLEHSVSNQTPKPPKPPKPRF